MRPRFAAAALMCLGGLSLAGAGGTGATARASVPDLTPDDHRAMEAAIARVKPALVQIYVVEVDYEDGREVKAQAAGSGVLISAEGHVISNHHVAGHARRLVCTLADNEEIEAVLVGSDALADVAVLQLKPKTPRQFPKAEFGDSDRMRVGDPVLAMGSPMALSQSVTLGIVSNTKMVLPYAFWPFDRFTLDGEDVGSIVRWIAHDAQIYGGNSGGPLVNFQGEIIGINEIRIGLSGAIPGNLAKQVAEELIRQGRVTRSWLGLEIQPLLKDGGRTNGVLISGTLAGAPARQAGFQEGDILLKLDGRDTTVRFQEEVPLLNLMVAGLPTGKPVEAVVLRGGKTHTLTVTTAEREELQPKQRELKAWGITVRNIPQAAARELKLESRDGALVTSVRAGGPSGGAKPMLMPYDVIVTVGGEPVRSVEELVSLTAKLREGQTKPVPTPVEYLRKTERLATVVRLGIEELEDHGLEVKKAWLSAATQVLGRDLAAQLGQPDLTGVRVTQVFPGGTTAQAGLKVGDLIVAVDGDPVPAAQMEDADVFPAILRRYPVGAKPEFTVRRGGQELKLRVELTRAPRLQREMKEYRDELFEFAVRDLCFFDKVRERWPESQTGVVVQGVEEGGWAELAHLGVGDLIQTVAGEAVADVETFRQKIRQVAERKPETVVLSVLRGIHHLYIELEPKWAKN